MRAAPVPLFVALALSSLACTVAQVPGPPPRPNRVVLGYYPSWDRAELGRERIPFEYLTHVAHAFAWPDAAGDLVVPAGMPDPGLNAAARAAGVKVLLSLGGWGNCAGFPGAVSTDARRSRLVGRLVEFCRLNAYDGVDIDWEFASNDAEKAGFTLFAEACAAAFRAQSPPLLLTMAAPSSDFHGRWIDFERLADDFDFIGFMTYGYHGEWSGHSGHNAPLYAYGGDDCGSLDRTFRYALGRGVPAAKILVGLAFFGRSFDCGGLGLPFTAGRSWDYREIAAFAGAEWTRAWDDAARVPWKRRADGGMVVSYDDPSSISLKCQYVKDEGAGGVIVWALGQDRRGGTSELLEAVGRSFGVR